MQPTALLSALSASSLDDDRTMDTFVALCAQLLPAVPPTVAVVLWLLLPRSGKVELGLRGVLAIALTGALVLLAGAAHADPRPFVVDPFHPALFPHAADNGFPSDHTAYATAAALVVVAIRRRLGLVLLAFATGGGLARVAANVHHLQDIAASLVIAAIAVAVSAAVYSAVQDRQASPAGPTDEVATRRAR